MTTAPAISVTGLRKAYGSFEAVRGIDLEVRSGEVFALLGPNGAGKTTTVEILEGYRPRTAGTVSVLGYDPAQHGRALLERVGIVLQTTAAAADLTVAEVIEMYRGYYPHPRPLEETMGLVGLTEQRNIRVRKLSGGQQRRLDVAIGLAGDPDLLFLDEPTTGFDPSARRDAWGLVDGLRDLGKTVFLTTHYMDEAQALADRVAIIARGEIVALGAPDDLIARDHVTTISFRDLEAGPPLPEVAGTVNRAIGAVHIETREPTAALFALTRWAIEAGRELEDLRVARPTLEEVYLELTRDSEAAHASDAAS